MDKNRLLELILSAVDDPRSLREWDLDGEAGSIGFTSEGLRYRVTTHLKVKVENGSAPGPADRAKALEECLEVAWVERRGS